MITTWDIMLQKIENEYKNHRTNFLRQPTISKTVHPNCTTLAKSYYVEMSKDPFCTENIFPLLNDSRVGNPFHFDLLKECSPVSITHSYQLYLLKKYANIFVPRDKISYIVELGGGYGHTCRMIMNYGYAGRYSIIDFPLMLAIQKDFLEQNNINNVEYHPLNMKLVQPKKDETSILFASFSVNEMPLEARQHIEPFYNQYDYLFFAHNSAFDEVDNVKYFTELKAKLSSDFNIDYFQDTHRGLRAWFMVCSKKNNEDNNAPDTN